MDKHIMFMQSFDQKLFMYTCETNISCSSVFAEALNKTCFPHMYSLKNIFSCKSKTPCLCIAGKTYLFMYMFTPWSQSGCKFHKSHVTLYS